MCSVPATRSSRSAELAAREDDRRQLYRLDLPESAAGFLIIKPLYRLSRRLRVRERDPLREARVRLAERRLSVPSADLRRDELDGVPQQVVLVHGLASTAAEMAGQLQPLGLSTTRFEHDTYVSIDDNAQEFAGLLRAKLSSARRIVVISHSRGGLVARAAADLVPSILARRLSIHTFGTPHLGTPLAEFGRLVPLLHLVQAARHPGDAIQSALRYLLPRTWATPEGIEEMSPEDAFIERMRCAPHAKVEALNSWSATFDPDLPSGWWQPVFAHACAAVLEPPRRSRSRRVLLCRSR